MIEPTSEQVERGTHALVPFKHRWNLPLNPENLQLMAYAVLRFAVSDDGVQGIYEGSERLLDEDAAAYARLLEAMERDGQPDE